MVQMNKYNAINSIKNNCLAEPHEAPGKGLTEANKEKDQNKRDIKKGGGGGGRDSITCARGEACCQAAQTRHT